MGVAHLAGMRSKDPSTQVGACIVSEDNKILSMGYNGLPRGCDDDEFPWDREGEELETKYPFDVVADGNVSIMQFSKEQYMNLLQTDTIYMLNYLNYLSYHSQRPIVAIKLLSDGSFESQLALWVMSMTDSDSTEISIICDKENLSRMMHISLDEMEFALQRIKSDGLIDYDENKIIIKSRSRLIDSVFEKL